MGKSALIFYFKHLSGIKNKIKKSELADILSDVAFSHREGYIADSVHERGLPPTLPPRHR